MALQIIRNDIINVEADAIVNTANPKVAVGPGVDQAIYTAAGWDRLLEARRAIGPMEPGEVAATPAYDLRAKYIIHAIGPAWRGGGYGERETVAECYSRSLSLAQELKCESIAFPLMATGTYGFPKDEALNIAMREISGFLLHNDMEVMLVVYDKESFEVSGKLFSDIKTFIEEEDVIEAPKRRRSLGSWRDEKLFYNRDLRRGIPGNRILKKSEAEEAKGFFPAEEPEYSTVEEPDFFEEMEYLDTIVPEAGAYGDSMMAPAHPVGSSLDERIIHMDKTFQQYLFMLIDRKGLTDPEVYRRANIDRKHFSKIRSDINYSPSRKTAMALAIALELSMDEAVDLIGRAGMAFSPASMFDQIIRYCIESGNYDIFEINNILFKYDQPTLGV